VRTFARAGYRPSARTPHGAAVPATVGLGSARTFATAPAAGTFNAGVHNVPIVLRAFASIFDDEDKLPRASQYKPYARPKRQRQQKKNGGIRRARRCRVNSISSATSERSILRELGNYFPLTTTVDEEDVALPVIPEQLVTPGSTSTLALPLAPSLSSLLAPTPTITYADAEIGVAILAGLTAGLLPLHDAYAAAGARVIPLLARLESLGVLAVHLEPATTLEVATDPFGEPDILRIYFNGRSPSDVLTLLGGTLAADADGYEWWALTESKHPVLSSIDEINEEQWDNMPAPSPTVELVMPTVDMSMMTAAGSLTEVELEMGNGGWPDWPPSPTLSPSVPSSPASPASNASTFSSGMATPHSYENDDMASWTTSPSMSHASLISAVALSLARSRSGSDLSWSSPPSEADDDVQSAWGSDGDAVHINDEYVLELDHSPGWVGDGLGLAQPW
jgi:hypothetical protein